jgi:hypothetical protein
VPKKIWPSGTRAIVRISCSYRRQVTPRTTERLYPIQTGTWCGYIRGSGVQGSRGSGFTGFRGQEVTGVQGFTGGFTVQTGGRGLGIGLGTADVALIQKFIVHRIHTPTVDLDEAELNSLNLWNLMNR